MYEYDGASTTREQLITGVAFFSSPVRNVHAGAILDHRRVHVHAGNNPAITDGGIYVGNVHRITGLVMDKEYIEIFLGGIKE